MKPPPFDYAAPASVEDAVAMLAAHGGEAKVLAGGQSLVPMLNFRLLSPPFFVDLNRIPGLAYVEPDGTGLRIGALTRHHALETSPLVGERFPVLADAMTHVAHLAVRNRGTIGGSLSHADPAAELPAMALLLDAEIRTANPRGGRNVAARDFFVGALTTALESDEIVTEIVFPGLPPATGWGFEELTRRHGDFAMAGAVATVTATDGRVGEARIALFGVDETPVRVPAAEALLADTACEPDAVAAAAEAARDAVNPMTDLHASADYRRHLTSVLVRRVVSAAWRRAGGGG